MEAIHDLVIEGIASSNREITSYISELVRNILENRIKDLLNFVPTTSCYVSEILLNKLYDVNRVIERVGIPTRLLITAVREAVSTVRKVCRGRCSLRKLDVDTFSDVEVKGWEGVMLRLIVEGTYDELLKVWDEVSIKVSKALGNYSRYIYVVIEPHE